MDIHKEENWKSREVCKKEWQSNLIKTCILSQDNYTFKNVKLLRPLIKVFAFEKNTAIKVLVLI